MADDTDNYGLDPNTPGADGLFPAFDPKYLTVIRVTGDNNWRLDVNYAHFNLKEIPGPAPRPDPIAPDKLLPEVLAVITSGGMIHSFRSKRAQLPRLYEWRGPPGKWDVDNFAGLGASCQTEMVFWLDIGSATVDPALAISFGRTLIGGRQAQPNDTYTATPAGSFRNGPLIRVRNHFAWLDPASGKYVDRPADMPASAYKMNVHFSLALGSATLGTIPMVIDPNTGNGGGAEP